MKKILTIIIDGFGYKNEEKGNAPKLANMENFNKIWEEYPHTTLYASEEYVGLKHGQFGNSEVGHMAIGAGRVIKQKQDIINDFFEEENNEKFNNMIDIIKHDNKTVHLMGICSDGNVHGSINDLKKMYKKLVDCGIRNIYFHLITDGRDTKVDVAKTYISEIESLISENQVGSIASVCGRFYAMDRDDNYKRTNMYYDLITRGIGISALNIGKLIDSFYKKNITDEFITPTILNMNGLIKDNDLIFLTNYRNDRIVQIVDALTNQNYDKFSIKAMPNLLMYTFFKVEKFRTINILDEFKVENPLGLYLASLDITQARIAESEKFPHVTYFFDGAYNGKISGCDKFEIDSPNVATYDLKPEMSAVEVTKKVINAMEKDYDFILMNFANPDMVGHTGNLEATINACKAVDICLGKILENAENNFYKVIIMSDHGNADTMLDENDNKVTTHSLAMVPFIILDKKIALTDGGSLINVAPTILDYMDISIPKEMIETKSLLIDGD